jgi:hypothetical protein
MGMSEPGVDVDAGALDLWRRCKEKRRPKRGLDEDMIICDETFTNENK